MILDTSLQAEGSNHIPRGLTHAKSTSNLGRLGMHILKVPPHMRAFEILEYPSEKLVFPFLPGMHASGPIANVEAIGSESVRKELVALLAR